MTTGERIRLRRKELGVSAEQLAERLGVSPATIYRYENGGIEKVPGDILPAISTILHTTPSYLMGWDDNGISPIPPGFEPMPEMATVPLVGRIACGEPILAEQNIEGQVAVPAAWRASFALLCKGDSMEPTVHDGDLVAIRKEAEIVNGQIYAVRIGEEARLKRVYRHPGQLILQSENPAYPPVAYSGPQLEEVAIEGKAVGFCRNL